jgi:protoheme IX farnesyltransferase
MSALLPTRGDTQPRLAPDSQRLLAAGSCGDGGLFHGAKPSAALLAAGNTSTCELAIADDKFAAPLTRAGAYLALTKPRISALVLVATAVSAWVARWGAPDLSVLLHALVGTALVAASSSAANQWIERNRDAKMRRTRGRPLPSGLLTEAEVLAFSAGALVAGVTYLWLAVNAAATLLAAATWLLYVAAYTPLKVCTPLNTHLGAVAGALPVWIGWAAVDGVWDVRAVALFLILFLWQFPHFMAIAWLYRGDYAQAGMKMLTVVDPSGRRAGVLAVATAMALVPVSVTPAFVSPGASVYAFGAIVLGIFQLAAAVTFFTSRDELSARRLLHASLIYLPALLALLLLTSLI